MKAKVIENVCIGCGACQALVPEVFEINDNGVAYAYEKEIKEELKEEVKEAKENCPTGAISLEEE